MSVTVHQVPFARPEFGDDEARAVAEVLRSGWASQGPAVARFEELFAQMAGTRHAVAVSSCTTALHLALILAGVEPGDEVICPSYSFIATANAVLYIGAIPISPTSSRTRGTSTRRTPSAASRRERRRSCRSIRSVSRRISIDWRRCRRA
jgi:perosamine synthetase